MILDKIVIDVKDRLHKTKSNRPFSEMKKLAYNRASGDRPSFSEALQKEGLSVIAEVKKGSPSKGLITIDFPYVQIAREYEKIGARAVSVLTEQDNFFGDVRYLFEIKKEIGIPVLRKDFIVDEYQIYEAAVIGADAILLIAALLDKTAIKEFLALADEFQMDCLVEIHDAKELEEVLETDARIIGINNRNLKTFHVDLSQTVQLRKLIPKERIVVSESGIQNNGNIQMLRNENIDAVLIGETLMRAKDKMAAYKELMAK